VLMPSAQIFRSQHWRRNVRSGNETNSTHERRSASLFPASTRRIRFTHMLVVANALHLLLMITFIALLLARMDGAFSCSYFVVMLPLWMSDVITLLTGAYEMRRALRSRTETPSRNQTINLINRLKGCLCVAAFKALLCIRLDGISAALAARLICMPYYVAALLRLVLHLIKTPLPGSLPRRTACGRLFQPRPGAPINPVHIMVILISCRIDNTFEASWALTFLPLWLLFSIVSFVCLGFGILAISIFMMRGPNERGQRLLFLVCFVTLLTITVTGSVFLVNLTIRLDTQDANASNSAICLPLIVGYSILLACYLVFTLLVPRLLLNDLAAAGEEQATEEEDTEEDSILDLVTQQLGPPFLVQHSSTLFKRIDMNTSTMFEALRARGKALAAHSESANKIGELSLSTSADRATESRGPGQSTYKPDIEEGWGGLDRRDSYGDDASLHAGGRGEASSVKGTKPSDEAMLSAPLTWLHVTAADARDHGEYVALQAEIEEWVQKQANALRRTHCSASQRSSAQGLVVPEEMKHKLQRLSALKQQFASAVCAVAAAEVLSSHGEIAEQHTCRNLHSMSPGEDQPSSSRFPAIEISQRPTISADSPDRYTAGGKVASQPPVVEAAAGMTLSPPSNRDVCVDVTDAFRSQLPTRALSVGALCTTSTFGDSEGRVVGDVLKAVPSSDGLSETARDDVDGGEGAEDKCWICFDGPRDAVLLECGHGGMCASCAKRVLRRKGRFCPMCRQPVVQMVQLRLESVRESEQVPTHVVPVLLADLPTEWLHDETNKSTEVIE